METTVDIIINSHQCVPLACHSSILGCILPVLACKCSLGIDSISYIQTRLIEFLAIAPTSLIQTDSIVQILIYLCISLSLSAQGVVAKTLVGTQYDSLGVSLMVAPAISIELHQTEERISTECKRLSLQKHLIALDTFCTIDIADDRVGIAHQFIIVVPRIYCICCGGTQVIGRVPHTCPTCVVTLLGIVAGKCAIPVQYGSLAVQTLSAHILRRHSLAQTVHSHFGLLCGAHHNSLVHLSLWFCIQIIART